jgi:hypothetical protein
MDRDLNKHKMMLQRYTARVREEVETAHMQFVQTQLAAIGSVIDASPTPRWLELPSIRVIPHSRNDRFFGRQTILAQMRKMLSPRKHRRESDVSSLSTATTIASKPSKQQRFALSGLGGSGKTQIALEYTYSHLDDYKVIIWILADSPEKISQGFGEVAEIMGMTGTQSDSQTRASVLQRLSATSTYLIRPFGCSEANASAR